MEIQQWMEEFQRRVGGAFGERLRFLGLQGSRARGEGRPDSDYDVVVLLDRVTLSDLDDYRAAVETLPRRDLLCGFVAGVEEMRRWAPADLFQFRFDTVAYYGRLEDFLPPLDREEMVRGLRLGACNCYHMGSHNYLHERSSALLRDCYKGAVFVLQAKVYLETGRYIAGKRELAAVLTGPDLAILQTAREEDWEEETLAPRTKALLAWTADLLAQEL